MNLLSIHRALRRASLILGLSLMGAGAAQAGAVSVDFDPAFGNSLPKLNWGGSFSFFVADSCITNAPDRAWSTVCQPTSGSATLTLTDTQTLQSLTASFNLNVLKLYVMDDAVVGWQTSQSSWLTDFRNLPAAKGNDFRFGYASMLPQLFASKPEDCSGRGNAHCEHEHLTQAGYSGLDGTITSVVNGQPVSYRLSYSNVVGAVVTPLADAEADVPEPGSLALLAAGLLAAGVVRRRRA